MVWLSSNKTYILTEKNQSLDLAPVHSFLASNRDYYLYYKTFAEKTPNINYGICDCSELGG